MYLNYTQIKTLLRKERVEAIEDSPTFAVGMMAAEVSDLQSHEPLYDRDTYQLDEVALEKKLRKLPTRYSKSLARIIEKLIRD